jgi:Na+-driven multidrug efflux pump
VILLELFSTQALGLFLPDGSVALHTAEHLNRIAAGSYVLLGASMVMFGVVRATGAVFPPLVVLALSLLGVRFPLAYFLLDTWGADAIWWSFPISALVAVLLSFLYYKYGHWRTLRIVPIPHRAAPIAATSAPAE